MILSVSYNKTTGEITASSDVSSILIAVNDNATDDNSSTLTFEVGIDTSSYEQINETPTE